MGTPQHGTEEDDAPWARPWGGGTRCGDRALTTCLKLIKGRPGRAKLEVVCDNYQEVVDEEMKMMAINTGAALGNKEAEDNIKFTNELSARLERAPYRADGDQILADS